eukprot:540762_1
MNNQQYNEWIPYLKLNHINHQIGFIIPWNIMHQIKYYYDEFTNDKTKANYTKSAFTLDFHCGITDRTLIHGILLINKIRFHAISYHQLVKYGVPSQELILYGSRCDDNGYGSKVEVTRAAVRNNCGSKEVGVKEVGVIDYGYLVMVKKVQLGIKANGEIKNIMELV